jgi:hypothetical protein
MAGAVLTPEDLEFEQARRVWNGDIDHHPVVIRLTGSSPVGSTCLVTSILKGSVITF